MKLKKYGNKFFGHLLLISVLGISLVACIPGMESAPSGDIFALTDQHVGKLTWPASAGDFSVTIINTVKEQTINLANPSKFPFTQIAFGELLSPFSYKGGLFPGVGGSCSDQLLPQQQCSIVLEFAPEEVKDIDPQNLSISYLNGVGLQQEQIVLQGQAVKAGEIAIFVAEQIVTEDTEDYFYPQALLGANHATSVRVKNIGGFEVRNLQLTLPQAPWSVISHDCPSSLPPGADCQVELLLAPPAMQNYYEALSASYHNGVALVPVAKRLIARVQKNAGEIILPSAGFYFSKQVINFPSQRQLTLKNTGAAKISQLTMQLPSGNDFSLNTNNCGEELAAGAECSLLITFLPSVGRVNLTQSINLAISYWDNDLASPQQVAQQYSLSGQGVSAANLAVDSVLNENRLTGAEINTLETVSIYLRNTGGMGAKNLQINNILPPFYLRSGQSSCLKSETIVHSMLGCAIIFDYRPEQAGNYQQTVNLSYDDGTDTRQTITRVFNASAIVKARLALSVIRNGVSLPLPVDGTASYPFTFYQQSRSLDFQLANVGTGPATLINMSMAVGPFSLVSSTCSAALLPAGGTCQFQLQYLPHDGATIEATDERIFTLAFDNGQGVGTANIQQTYTMAGTTSPPADLELLDLGGSLIPGPYLITLPGSNPGGSSSVALRWRGAYFDPAKITNWSLANGSVFQVLQDCFVTLPFTLAKGAECPMVVKFNPPADALDGTLYTDTLQLVIEDGMNNSHGVALAFEATSVKRAELVLVDLSNNGIILDSQIDYLVAKAATNQATSILFAIKNIGKLAATNVQMDNLPAPFSLAVAADANCLLSIPPGGQCNFTLQFAPTVKTNPATNNNTYLANWQWHYGDNVDSSLLLHQSLLAQAFLPPNFKVVAGGGGSFLTSYDFAEVPLSLSRVVVFTVKNEGEYPAVAEVTNDFNANFLLLNNTCQNYRVPERGNSSGSSCSFSVRFVPQALGAIGPQNVVINYQNNLKTLTLSVSGVGIDPVARFQNWTKIYAVSGSGDNSSTINLQWENFLLPSSSWQIIKYFLYRSTTPLDKVSINNGLITPYKIIDPPTRNYSESGLAASTTYYYAIRPVVEDSGDVQLVVVDDDAQLAVLTPPVNMALIHPKMANWEVCQQLGYDLTLLRADQYYGCSDGTRFGGLRLERAFFVDRYEASSSGSMNSFNLTPVTLNQYQAVDHCLLRPEVQINNKKYRKRPLTRQEQFLAAKDTPKDKCNLQSAAAVKTGKSTGCVSAYGISDLVGNVWEWTIEWVYNTQVVANLNVSQTAAYNQLMVGVFLNHSNVMANDAQCLSWPLGLPFAIDADGQCTFNARPVASFNGSIPVDLYYSPLFNGTLLGPRGILGGGSFNSGINAGRWSSNFRYSPADTSQEMGTRCGFALE